MSSGDASAISADVLAPVVQQRAEKFVAQQGGRVDGVGPRGGGRIRSWSVGLLFVLPAVLLAAVFVYYPAVSALWHSMFNWSGVGTGTFVGLNNFSQLAADPVMRLAVINVLKLAAFSMVVSVVVPLPVARVITSLRSTRAQYLWRVLFVIPFVIPNVVIYLVWQFLYDPNFGPLNKLLTLVGLPPQGWLGSPAEALYAVMGVGFPWVQGFALLIFIAGIQAIPRELIDAGRVDGCGAWKAFRHLELPLLKGQVRLVLILNMIWTIQGYTMIFILTLGGPVNATMVPGMYLYQNAFQNQQMGYASAIGVVMFVVSAVLTYLNLRYVKPAVDYSKERGR
jgi:raffinose/stachyose/melibiose transport system permease protein